MLRHFHAGAAETGRALHRVLAGLLTLLAALTLLCVVAAWRLSSGPVELNFLKDRIEAAVNRGIAPARISIGTASVAWRGFSEGVNRPLVLRIADLTMETGETQSRVHIPLVDASLSMRALLIGRAVPKAIVLEGPRLTLIRAADGTIALGFGGDRDTGGASPLDGLLDVLGAPAGSDHDAGETWLAQLATLSIRGAALTLDDRRSGAIWSADSADLDLSRRAGGRLEGRAAIRLGMGGALGGAQAEPERRTGPGGVPGGVPGGAPGGVPGGPAAGGAGPGGATLNATFSLEPGARAARISARIAGLRAQTLAKAVPALAALAALEAVAELEGNADFGPDLVPLRLRATARLGMGQLSAGDGTIPFQSAAFAMTGTPGRAVLESASVALWPKPGGPVTMLRGSGEATGGRDTTGQTGTGWEDGAAIGLRWTLDRVNFADLPAIWPKGIAKNARQWVATNVAAGIARDGRVDLAVTVAPDGNVALTRIAAVLEGEDATVTWLPTVPPVERARVRLTMTEPDRMEFDILAGRQAVRGGEPIGVRSGHISIAGLMVRDQVATIRCEASGSLASAIALLKEPRLRVLDRHPIDLREPAGEARMSFQVTVPLESNLRFDDVKFHGAGTLNRVHLTGLAAGRDVDEGAVAVDVDVNRMTLKGTARIGGIPATLDALLDFRAGPPGQTVQRFALTAKSNAAALPAAGLDHGGMLTGDVAANAVVSLFRNGDGEIAVDADLTAASTAFAPLAWRKPAGTPTKATARLKLSKDRLTAIDAIAIDGTGLTLRGAIAMSAGAFDTIRLDRAVFGRNDFAGTIRVRRGEPFAADLSGAALDLSPKLAAKPDRKAVTPDPAFTLRLGFKRVYLAHDRVASDVTATAIFDGEIYRSLTAGGTGGTGLPFAARLGTENGARRVLATAGDGGEMLAALDIYPNARGGALKLTGVFDDSNAGHDLSGQIEISEFRVIRAPVLGKLLQAVTLYGLFDALDGAGLRFSSLIAPFQLSGPILTLREARAFSPSLGLTAKGRIDRGAGRLDLEGSLVPAYLFNSLLGRIPLIGGLFAAEKDGGLIAMNYSVRGPADDPSVSVNPLSAVTPGILRGMFQLFDQAPP